MLKNKFILIIIVLSLNSITAIAQINTISPYSRFGLGDLHFNGFSKSTHMAGLSAPIDSEYHLNNLNPASYSQLNLTSFEMAFASTYHHSSNDSLSEENHTNFLQHIGIGFPISKKCGASFGLYPYSSVGYSLIESIDSENRTENYIYEGNGGMNTFYLGTSYEILKGLTIGINANYHFGSLEELIAIEMDTSSEFNSRNITSTTIGDFNYDFGLLYSINFKKNYNLTIGGTYSPKTNLNSHKNQLAYTYLSSNGYEYIKDTIINTSVTDYINYPYSYSLGMGFGKAEKWFAGLEYKSQNWEDFLLSGNTDSLVKNQRIGVGFYLKPSDNPLEKYSNLIEYRGGVFYDNSLLQLNNKQLKHFGISFGVGLPLRKQFSTLNFGVTLGQNGTTENNLIRERYANFNFGITINDKWFIKRKIK